MVGSYRNLVDEWLIETLPKGDKESSILSEGMYYMLLNGGKRIRPVFAVLGGKIAGLEEEQLKNLACGIEYIHTYSLVHDDLPAMDNDILRRGKPTCHIAYGEGEAILIGDALLTEGMLKLVLPVDGVCNKKILKSARLFLKGAGISGMIGGQLVDIKYSEGKRPEDSEGTLKYIHTHKTGALLTNSLLCGALLGESDDEMLEDLRAFGEAYGLTFQIVDDILDVISTKEEMGKNTGSDEENTKLTYPRLYGLDASKILAEETLSKGMARVEKYGEEGRLLMKMGQELLAKIKRD